MNCKTPIAVALLSVVVGCGCSHDDASHESHADHASHEAHSTAAAPTLPPGQRWATDEALRAAMLRIRQAVEKSEPAFAQKQLTATDAQALAVTVEENIQYMIAHCKLAPDPDAALHVLIGRMMSAATALKSNATSDAGIPQLIVVLRDYQSTFDHPDWQPMIEHPAHQ